MFEMYNTLDYYFIKALLIKHFISALHIISSTTFPTQNTHVKHGFTNNVSKSTHKIFFVGLLNIEVDK